MAAGMFYWLVPRLYGIAAALEEGGRGALLARHHRHRCSTWSSMWVSGVNQGLMWRRPDADGTLIYPNFVETLLAIRPMYIIRFLGGLMYLAGFVLMIWNLLATARAGKPVNAVVDVVVADRPATGEQSASARCSPAARSGSRCVGFLAACALRAGAAGAGDRARGAVAGHRRGRLRGHASASARRASPPGSASSRRRPLAFTVLTLIADPDRRRRRAAADHPDQAGGAADRRGAEALHARSSCRGATSTSARAATSATRR